MGNKIIFHIDPFQLIREYNNTTTCNTQYNYVSTLKYVFKILQQTLHVIVYKQKGQLYRYRLDWLHCVLYTLLSLTVSLHITSIESSPISESTSDQIKTEEHVQVTSSETKSKLTKN